MNALRADFCVSIAGPPADFDSIIADYLPPSKIPAPSPAAAGTPKSSKPIAGYLDGLF